MPRPDPVHRKADQALAALKEHADPEKAEVLLRYFKTGPGQYGEGDRFLGVVVPAVRQIAREARGLPVDEVRKLLLSPFNEARLLGLILLVDAYDRGDDEEKTSIYRFYWEHRACANNWNLVDTSAPGIVGAHLMSRDRKPAYQLARSKGLWDRRIGIVCSLAWIRQGDVGDTYRLVEKLLRDEHDLIQKACGWMLREAGKKDEGVLRDFLDEHAASMPRTMLRYAIERLSPTDRKAYLARR